MSQEADERSVAEETANAGADVEMIEDAEPGETVEGENGGDLPFADADIVEPRTTFMSYLMSPIVTLLVGQGEEQAVLSAHQTLLTQSPYFEAALSGLADDASVSSAANWRSCAAKQAPANNTI